MSFSFIKVESPSPYECLLTLNRPEKRNALNAAMMQEICNAVDRATQDSKIRVMIIKGEDPVFCAGLDLAEAADESMIETSSELMSHTLTRVYKAPFVTIAAVQGAALAGGAGLMLACDFAVAANDAVFGFPETRRGLVAAQVMTLLVRQLRHRDIHDLLLLGETVSSEKALSIGLINQVVNKNQLMSEARRVASLALKGAPEATTKTKRLLESLYPTVFSDDLQKAMKYHQEMRHSKEAKEGIAAFLEKRKPSWDT